MILQELKQKLRAELDEYLPYRADDFDNIYAIKITNRARFEHVKTYFTIEKKNKKLAEIEGDWNGPDWYFLEATDIGLNTYHLESLSHKKEIFNRFLEDYND